MPWSTYYYNIRNTKYWSFSFPIVPACRHIVTIFLTIKKKEWKGKKQELRGIEGGVWKRYSNKFYVFVYNLKLVNLLIKYKSHASLTVCMIYPRCFSFLFRHFRFWRTMLNNELPNVSKVRTFYLYIYIYVFSMCELYKNENRRSYTKYWLGWERARFGPRANRLVSVLRYSFNSRCKIVALITTTIILFILSYEWTSYAYTELV